MNKMNKKLMGAFTAIIIIAVIIIGGYAVMTKQAQKKAQQEVLPSTEVGKILAKDLETKYPETPTEVVKMYWRISCCMYNDDSIADDDFEKMLKKIRVLYDDEFLKAEENSFDNMLKKFKSDKKKRQDEGKNIGSYVVQKNDTVEIKTVDKEEYATVVSSALIKAKGKTQKTYEKFMCRKSKDGRWKILGWQQINKEAAEEAGVE